MRCSVWNEQPNRYWILYGGANGSVKFDLENQLAAESKIGRHCMSRISGFTATMNIARNAFVLT